MEALPAGGASEPGVSFLMDPLVVAQEPSQSEGFPAGGADVPLLLRVDAHVVAQRHVVGVGLVTVGAAEVAGLVRVLVVQKAAGVLVRTATEVAGKRSLLAFWRSQVTRLHS